MVYNVTHVPTKSFGFSLFFPAFILPKIYAFPALKNPLQFPVFGASYCQNCCCEYSYPLLFYILLYPISRVGILLCGIQLLLYISRHLVLYCIQAVDFVLFWLQIVLLVLFVFNELCQCCFVSMRSFGIVQSPMSSFSVVLSLMSYFSIVLFQMSSIGVVLSPMSSIGVVFTSSGFGAVLAPISSFGVFCLQ